MGLAQRWALAITLGSATSFLESLGHLGPPYPQVLPQYQALYTLWGTTNSLVSDCISLLGNPESLTDMMCSKCHVQTCKKNSSADFACCIEL